MKKILITGGSGFLGRHICQKAEEKGYTVISPRSKEFNLETGVGLYNYMEEESPIDCIIHSAAYYGGIGINTKEPASIFYKNMRMTTNIFELAKDYDASKIIPIGSACAYPGNLKGDMKEEDFWSGPLHETVEAYGLTKKTQLIAQKAYYKQYGLQSNHLILTNLYGPYDVFHEYRSHVPPALIKKFLSDKDVELWGDGSPIREFLYVEDAAEAIVRSIELPHSLEPLNIGTGIGTSIQELAQFIQTFTKFTGKVHWDTTKPNGTLRKVLNIQKMKNLLQWEPKFSLEEGLKKTIDWYIKNRELADQRR